MISGSSDYTEGTNMTLICEAMAGNPDQYEYSWTFLPKHGGSNLTFNSKKSVVKGYVQYTDAGTYICNANNIAGNAVGSNYVEVRCKSIGVKLV